jgi:hypothetical protein
LGALSRARFREERRTWLEREARRGASPEPLLAWWEAYGAAIQTQEDATEALAVLPKYGEPSASQGGDARYLGDGAEAYLMTGRRAEAIEYLRAAARECPRILRPLTHLRALERLAAALAPTDPASACDAYARILVHLDRTPGSVTAQRARLGRQALHCNDVATAAAP